MSRAAAEVGSTANSYQILAKLASGGMAEIFLARAEGVAGVERYCVLKRILRDRASDVQFVQMFLDEARLAAQLQHPNIAQVYDIGKLGDSFFFTMEYVHGETVRALLHRAVELRRKLPIPCVLTIVAGAAAGLHHAHVRVGVDGRALGIVHRDVSPSNLMASYEGSVKLVDFGVAKASDRAHETKSGTVKGKISYLSPEQCRGKRVDRRSDLFSLGICLWEMLTAERLYRRASDFENMNAIASEPPPPPSSRRADIPPEIDALVLRLLAKDPDARCQTADEVVDAIETLAARTSSMLSASALGRLVRELFGPRPEPWLELERLHRPGEGVTMTGEPIPHELAIPPADRIDHQLAGVIDLSEPRQATESLEALPVPRPTPTTHLGKPGKRGFPLAAPPPTHPGIEPVGRGGSASARPHRDEPRDATRGRPLSIDRESSSGIALPAPPEAPAPLASASASFVVPGPAASASFVVPGPAASASFVVPGPADPRAFGSGPFAAPSGSHALGAAGLRRVGWPLVAVIAGACVIGSLGVVLAMRSGTATVTSAATAPAARAPARPRAEPIERELPAPPATLGMPPATLTAAEIAPPPVQAPRIVVASGAAPAAAESAAPLPGAAPAHASAPPKATRALRGSGALVVLRATDAHDRPADELSRLYGDGLYEQVVALCGKSAVGAERAPLCFLAACHVRDEAAARRVVAAVPALLQRDQLVTNCKQFGVDVAKDERCEADPMACQH
ncbi:MAG TPA: serine/threonine-protein kinase [Kofleriaceae bacterium]|nr:serine/threonine-protein kinase [Kofleriaceae bacterium]